MCHAHFDAMLESFHKVAFNGRACCCAGIHCSSSPIVSRIKLLKVQITNKSSKEIGLPKPMLIVKKR